MYFFFFCHYTFCSCNSKKKHIFLISIVTPSSETELFGSFFVAADFTPKAALQLTAINCLYSLFLCSSCGKYYGDRAI